MIVSESEYHERYLLVEVMARAISNLTIISFQASNDIIPHRHCLRNTIDKLIDCKDLVDYVFIDEFDEPSQEFLQSFKYDETMATVIDQQQMRYEFNFPINYWLCALIKACTNNYILREMGK